MMWVKSEAEESDRNDSMHLKSEEVFFVVVEVEIISHELKGYLE